MKIFIVNSQINNTSKELLNRYGNIAEVAAHDMLPYAEKHHADMQFARIDSRTLVCAPGSSCNVPLTGLNVISGSVALKEKYPDNIAYNILRAGNFIFHNTKYTAPEITELARLKNGKIIHTLSRVMPGVQPFRCLYRTVLLFSCRQTRGLLMPLTN